MVKYIIQTQRFAAAKMKKMDQPILVAGVGSHSSTGSAEAAFADGASRGVVQQENEYSYTATA